MKPLTVREWLEAERLSGLPHADFAAEALTALDELDDLNDEVALGAQALCDVEDVEKQLKGCGGKNVVERAEWAMLQLDNLIEIHGGEYATVVERAEAADLRWWDIWDVLVEAGLVERHGKAADVDVPSLLRMFLPT